tara:strand:+ start:49 stop:687 length:639 start_codon:yes stop_codon:yes gene_type:complete
MKTPFKLKSGNKTSFKDMGSSPVKLQTYTDKAKRGGTDAASIDFSTPVSRLVDKAKNMRTGVGDFLKDKVDIKGYLKGEQGLIPDYKGESTAKTASKVSSSIQKGYKNVKDAARTGYKKGKKVAIRKVDGKVAKKVTPTEVLKEGTEDGSMKKMMKMKDSFRKQEIQKQLDPLQKELDKKGQMKKVTRDLKKKGNTTQENLNKNIQKGIGTY